MDLFVFPHNRVLPRGGVPLTLPRILYKKEGREASWRLFCTPPRG